MEIIDNSLNGIIDDSDLSKEAKSLLSRWDQSKKNIERPSWSDFFLLQAYHIASRSPDARTKHGAVIVNESKEIVVTGFNGFIRDIDDRWLPNFDENKYDFFIHAEANALLNAARQGRSVKNCTAYITGPPCLTCFQFLWQSGIKRIICGNRSSHMNKNEEYNTKMEILKAITGNRLSIMERVLDPQYIENSINELRALNNV